MADEKFPPLDPSSIDGTRKAVHAYARVAGAWSKALRKKRKHWWHASMRPSLYGLTTGVIYGKTDFEIEVDLANSQLCVRTCSSQVGERLTGQSSSRIAETVSNALRAAGFDPDDAVSTGAVVSDDEYPTYSADQANLMHRALGSIAAVLEDFRATIREEKSPIQVWPHHFDLSMIWLPGPKVPGQDVANEEYADKQMNFGFAFGDEAIPEPYFYVTAYPLPDSLPNEPLPDGTVWHSDGFDGAVLKYRELTTMQDPAAYLIDMWTGLLEAARGQLSSEN
ncbi:MAG: DUF5996 family protein [Woeseiaceae bacterium]|nr:DUF5996 family protein [Woeseiaceae bacterium]